jgi:DNA-binding GntR family transcriptional regulator
MDTTSSVARARPQDAQDSVYLRLRHDVLSGKLSANERLKVSTLAAQYQTSTNPVREALQQLRGEGLVVISPNRGARVRAVDEDFVRDIYEIEALIEPYLTRWFVGVCTKADIVALQVIQAEIVRVNFTDLAHHSELDTQFHRIMYDQHYNRHAVDLWWSHRELLSAINAGHQISLRRQREILVEHQALINALTSHDEDRAVKIITQHVRGSGKHIMARLGLSSPRHMGSNSNAAPEPRDKKMPID